MKEIIVALTRSQPSPRLDRGVIFMAEPAKNATIPVEQQNVPSMQGISPAWQESLDPQEQHSLESTSVAKLGTEMGIEPPKREKPDQDTLDKNAALDDAGRLEEARKLLREIGVKKPDEVQEKAIIAAHEVGLGEKGIDGHDARVGYYTPEQLREKAEILKKAGLNKEARRILMEHAIVGSSANVVDLDTFDPASYRDAVIRGNAEELHRRALEEHADEEFLRDFARDIRQMKNQPGVSNTQRAEADRLIDEVERVRHTVEQRDQQEQQAASQGQGQEQRGRNRRGGYAFGDIGKIAAAANAYADERKTGGRNIERERLIVAAIKKQLFDPRTPPVDTNQFPYELLEAAASFEETREMLISQIIFKSFQDDTERNDFDIDWNAKGNLKQLLEAVRLSERQNPGENPHYQDLLNLETSARLFHTMNGRILAGDLEQFGRIAGSIDPNHYRVMNSLKGVGQVMRLYEQKYAEELAKHGAIYDYDAVKREVQDSFTKMAKSGFIKTTYDTRVDDNAQPSKILEDWEIERALSIGRNFANITFRAGEYIALGEPSVLPGNIRFGSGPQESSVKLLNHMQWVADRFAIGDARGGAMFYELVKKHFHENNMEDQISGNKRKLGINEIKKFGGRTVDEMEIADFFGIKSFYSSWRLQNMTFPQITFDLHGQKMNLKEWFDVHSKPRDPHSINEIRDHVSPGDHIHVHGDMHHAQEELATMFKPLIENLHHGLGILLVNGAVAGEPGYLVRKMIWEKVASTNIPTMMTYLEGLEMEIDSSVYIKNLKALQEETGITGDAFTAFKEKVIQEQQRGVLKAAGEVIDDISLKPLSPQEERLKDLIRNEGLKLAPHFADIIFPYTPFMNDVQFEKFDYKGPGQEAYKRLIGDYGQYAQAQHGYDKLQDHPGQFKVDDLVKALKEMETGMSGPPGPREGMTRSLPVVQAVLDFYETEGDPVGMEERIEKTKKSVEKEIEKIKERHTQGNISKKEMGRLIKRQEARNDPKNRESRNGSWIRKQMLLRLIKQSTEHATSGAQTYASVEAESFDEGAMRAFAEKLNHAGVLTHAQMARIRKKKRLTAGWLLGAIFRDIFPFIVAAGISAIAAEAAVEVLGQPSGGHH